MSRVVGSMTLLCLPVCVARERNEGAKAGEER